MMFFKLHKHIQIRVLIIFVNNLVTNMIFPFMTIYLSKQLGLTLAGSVMIAATTCAIIGSLLGGGLSDKIGRRKVMIISEISRIVIFLGFMMSTSQAYYSSIGLGVCFILRNFFNGLYGPASESMLLDLSLPEQRTNMYQIIYWVNNFSLAIGVLIGTYFFENYMTVLFFILFIVSILTTIATYRFISESIKMTEEKRQSTIFSHYRVVLKDKVFLLYFVANVLIFSLDTNITKFMSIAMTSKTYYFLNDIVEGQQFFGFLLTENTILVVLLSIIISLFVLSEKRHNLIFFVSMLTYICSFALLPLLDNAYVLLFVMGLGTLGEVIFAPLFQKYIGDIAVETYRSTYIGIHKLSYRLSTLLSSGLIILLGYTSITFVSILVLMLALGGYIIMLYLLPIKITVQEAPSAE